VFYCVAESYVDDIVGYIVAVVNQGHVSVRRAAAGRVPVCLLVCGRRRRGRVSPLCSVYGKISKKKAPTTSIH